MAHPTIRTMPDVEFAGLVRARDLDPSWVAASKQTRSKSTWLQDDLEWILRTVGPLNDDELGRRYRTLSAMDSSRYRRATQQSIRTRRKELERQMRVGWTADKRPSDNGGPSTVWAAKPHA